MALGIIGRPELIFLDEPTTGFDPSARRGAWELVRSLTGSGTTVVLTTHYMDEAQQLADRIAVIAGGQIVATGSPETIGGRNTATARIRFSLPAGVSPGDLPVPVEPDGEAVRIDADDETAGAARADRLGAGPRGARWRGWWWSGRAWRTSTSR